MVDWFGGANNIPVKDYLAYNYTGMEIYDYYYRTKNVQETEGDNVQSSDVYLTE